MEDDYEDQSSCGCKEFFCCIFPTSRKNRDSGQTRYQPPSMSGPPAENPKPGFEPQTKPQHNAPDFGRHVQQQGSRSSSDINKAFSEYINQGRVKIRAMSNAGADDMEIAYSKADEVGNRSSQEKVDANDIFVDYINRTKKNIRKTSSHESKRVISFRKWE